MSGIVEIDGVRRRIVDREDWRRSHEEVLAREKALTRAHDELAAERRRTPWVKVEKAYAFEGPAGKSGLGDLFDGRSQLIVYHHMLRPAQSDPCSGGGMVADQLPHLAHLHERNTSLVFVSRASSAAIEILKKRMGWSMRWFSIVSDDFNSDFDVTTGFGLNVFYCSGADIYRTYFTKARGVETLGTVWTLLDLTPLGRQETWEESPAGTPQTRPYHWWRLHDEYQDRRYARLRSTGAGQSKAPSPQPTQCA